MYLKCCSVCVHVGGWCGPFYTSVCVFTLHYMYFPGCFCVSAAVHCFILNTFWPLRLSGAFLWWLCLWKENSLQKPGAPGLCRCWNSDISAEVQVCGGVLLAQLFQENKQLGRYSGTVGERERLPLCCVLLCNMKKVKRLGDSVIADLPRADSFHFWCATEV